MNKNYYAEVKESSRELTARERIKLKDMSNAISLDEATQEAVATGANLVIDVAMYAIVGIHNEKSDDKDYDKCVVVDKDGNKYETGSVSFIRELTGIADELAQEGDDNLTIEVYRKPSPNYKGKEFITCSLV